MTGIFKCGIKVDCIKHYLTVLNWDKKFIGKEAALKEKQEGPKKKLITMTIETKDIDVTGDEAIMKDGKCVGYITSGGYAHHVKKSMAMLRDQEKTLLKLSME